MIPNLFRKLFAENAISVAFIPTFKDYLDKWVYSIKDNDDLLNKIGGARLAALRVVPGLGYSVSK